MSNLYRNKISRVFAKYAKRGMGHVSKPCLMDVGSEADATIATLRGAMDAQDGRERAAGARCGVDYNIHGCDWPDAVADEVIHAKRAIATLTAERDAERASAMAFHVELQRLRMWCGGFVSRIEQMGVVGISDDADLVDIFREAAEAAQLKEQD